MINIFHVLPIILFCITVAVSIAIVLDVNKQVKHQICVVSYLPKDDGNDTNFVASETIRAGQAVVVVEDVENFGAEIIIKPMKC